MLLLYKNTKFDKDIQRMKKRGKKLEKLWNIIELLVSEVHLPVKARNHALSGDFSGFMECHIEPDWLLIYEINNECVILARTGTHSDLFG